MTEEERLKQEKEARDSATRQQQMKAQDEASTKQVQSKTATAVADPADPYQNFQDVGSTKSTVDREVGKAPAQSKIYEVNRDYVEENRIRQENMRAKEAEIKAPGSLTQAEADKLKQGMDPAKQSEIQAQVVSAEKVKDQTYVDNKYNEIQIPLMAFLGDSQIGRNELRNRIKTLRQQLQELERTMDLGLV